MDNRKALLAAIAVLAIIFAADAFWLFGIALPHHPPAVEPTPVRSRASPQDREAYEAAIDSAEARNWERRRVINTAIVVPGVALLCAGTILLIRRLE